MGRGQLLKNLVSCFMRGILLIAVASPVPVTTMEQSTVGCDVTAPLQPFATTIGAADLYYMFPETPTVGILLYFHGCNHGGQDFFYLPEERLVAKSALDRGLAVLSVSSRDRSRGCWDSAKDLEFLPGIVNRWLETVGLPETLPRMGMGEARGGSFLFKAHQALKLSSIASYVSPAGFSEEFLSNNLGNIPATAFVHMPRDHGLSQIVQNQVAMLQKYNVPTGRLEVHPHPFTPQICNIRIPELGADNCETLFNQIRTNHPSVLDEDYTVLKSYFLSEWSLALEESNLLGPRSIPRQGNSGLLRPWQHAGYSWLWASMVQEVAVAFAQQVMTSEHRHEVLDFLMRHANIVEMEEIA